MNKKEFNLRFLGSVATVALPTLRASLLRECRENIEIDGLGAAIRQWANFIGIAPSQLTPGLNLPPSPVMGLQLNFAGKPSPAGKQMRLRPVTSAQVLN